MRRAGSIVLGLVLLLGAAPARAQSIFDVVTTGTPGQVRALAARDASLVNVKDAAGKTPLHHAAIVGSVPMIECLLSLGAAIDAANTENLTPLLEAVRSGKDAAANALIEKGARIDGVLHAAARYNRAAVIGSDLDFAAALRPFATLTNTAMKVSGYLTSTGDTPLPTIPGALQPYLDAALDIFGPDRLLFGSDWPVCTQRGTYADAVSALRTLTLALSPSEQAAIWGNTATRVYHL